MSFNIDVDPLRVFINAYIWIFVYFICDVALKEQKEGGKSAYGRYTERTVLQGWQNDEVPAYLAWFLFEGTVLFSNFFVFYSYFDIADDHRKITVSLFLFHYVLRTFIYPYLARNGKPWRKQTVVFALIYNPLFAPVQATCEFTCLFMLVRYYK